MKPGMILGMFGMTLLLGATGCGKAGPTAAPASSALQSQPPYSVQAGGMMPTAPAARTAPTTRAAPVAQQPRGINLRFRPRGASIYLRGVPIIPETYPVPSRQQGTVTLRGAPIIPGTFNVPYPRPEEEIRQQRRMDTARAQLTEVENRIQQLEDTLSLTNVPSLRTRIWAELQKNRAYQATLNEILSGSSQ